MQLAKNEHFKITTDSAFIIATAKVACTEEFLYSHSITNLVDVYRRHFGIEKTRELLAQVGQMLDQE